MAYSTQTTPLPPPPPMSSGAFSHAYNLHQTSVNNPAQHGIAPVNQMSNGFGGRTSGNPTLSMTPQVSGGNRTSQHVATPGNNNVSYATPSLLNSAQSLWQRAQSSGVPTANGMSLGFMKNTAQRPGFQMPAAPQVAAPVVAPPPQVAINTESQNEYAAKAKAQAEEQKRLAAIADQKAAAANGSGGTQTGTFAAPTSPVGTVAKGTPAPVKMTMTEAQARQDFLASHKGSSLTMKGPNGSTVYTPAWAAYRETVNIKG